MGYSKRNLNNKLIGPILHFSFLFFTIDKRFRRRSSPPHIFHLKICCIKLNEIDVLENICTPNARVVRNTPAKINSALTYASSIYILYSGVSFSCALLGWIPESDISFTTAHSMCQMELNKGQMPMSDMSFSSQTQRMSKNTQVVARNPPHSWSLE